MRFTKAPPPRGFLLMLDTTVAPWYAVIKARNKHERYKENQTHLGNL